MDTDKKFYKDVQIVKWCKHEGCGVEFRPRRYSRRAASGYCIPHWKEYARELFRDKWKNLSHFQKYIWKTRAKMAWVEYRKQNRPGRAAASLRWYHENKERLRVTRSERRRAYYKLTGK